jgi:hypothetical protein
MIGRIVESVLLWKLFITIGCVVVVVIVIVIVIPVDSIGIFVPVCSICLVL